MSGLVVMLAAAAAFNTAMITAGGDEAASAKPVVFAAFAAGAYTRPLFGSTKGVSKGCI
jgi:hypothetical protein